MTVLEHEYSGDGTSPEPRGDESGRLPSARATGDECTWCRITLPPYGGGRRRRYCGERCRQAAFRLRCRRQTEAVMGAPMRLAYADPPYPGKARRYYRKESTYAGEVDHRALIASLEASEYDGWALSTSADALRTVLPMCPEEAHVCPWVKPFGVAKRGAGRQLAWEALIVVRGRSIRPGKRDWLRAHCARGGGSLMGRKPLAFCGWMFDMLGLLPGDSFSDLFPGTGVVGKAARAAGAILVPFPESSSAVSSPGPRGDR